MVPGHSFAFWIGTACLLTLFWKELIEEGMLEHPKLQASVPAVLCWSLSSAQFAILIGNASEFIFEKRHSKILSNSLILEKVHYS